jgi:hypothetical protein
MEAPAFRKRRLFGASIFRHRKTPALSWRYIEIQIAKTLEFKVPHELSRDETLSAIRIIRTQLADA